MNEWSTKTEKIINVIIVGFFLSIIFIIIYEISKGDLFRMIILIVIISPFLIMIIGFTLLAMYGDCLME